MKSELSKCCVCRKVEGGPFATPKMAPLPTERVNPSPAFLNCGVDYFGPLFVKAGEVTKKVWVTLYTCLVTRAVHLELVDDMTTEQFILSFRRFVSRRGCPIKMWSDNAPQFIQANSVLDEVWSSLINDEVLSYVENQQVSWSFIVQHAPWMGGAYERLVGLVKRALRKSIGRRCLNRTQLETIITEAEAIVNSRPLVMCGSLGEGETLTPAHFLTLRSSLGLTVFYTHSAAHCALESRTEYT